MVLGKVFRLAEVDGATEAGARAISPPEPSLSSSSSSSSMTIVLGRREASVDEADLSRLATSRCDEESSSDSNIVRLRFRLAARLLLLLLEVLFAGEERPEPLIACAKMLVPASGLVKTSGDNVLRACGCGDLGA